MIGRWESPRVDVLGEVAGVYSSAESNHCILHSNTLLFSQVVNPVSSPNMFTVHFKLHISSCEMYMITSSRYLAMYAIQDLGDLHATYTSYNYNLDK